MRLIVEMGKLGFNCFSFGIFYCFLLRSMEGHATKLGHVHSLTALASSSCFHMSPFVAATCIPPAMSPFMPAQLSTSVLEAGSHLLYFLAIHARDEHHNTPQLSEQSANFKTDFKTFLLHNSW